MSYLPILQKYEIFFLEDMKILINLILMTFNARHFRLSIVKKVSFPLFVYRVDFMSDKTALGAGKKRTLNFTSGPSPQENIVAEGMLKSALTVSVAQVS